MKSFVSKLVFAAVLLYLGGCARETRKMESNGRNYEVYVMVSRAVWESPVGDTLRAILLEPVPMLNQIEPHLDLVPIVPEAVTSLIARHNNILNLNISEQYPNPSMTVQYDVNAAPQIMVDVSGPSDSVMVDYIWANRMELRAIFEIAERDRFTKWATKYNEMAINDRIKEMFGFQMIIPRGYKMRNESENFMWISYELPLVSQGIMVYSYPYTGKSDFTIDSLISKRNQFVKRVPGPSDGSYMQTNMIMEPDVKYVDIDARHWAEMKGFWDVKGDFMGGPFTSYSTLDKATNRVVCIDTYVFSPKYNKRNYVRQLENIIQMVKFDAPENK